MARTLSLDGLVGYTTGGTLTLITNNQVGFMADPVEGRSTRYASRTSRRATTCRSST